MELIKETGSKSWINKSGKKDSKKFGIFLCPVCKKEVEKSLSHGKRANSCGDNSCRKEMFRPNKSNIGNTKFIKDNTILCKSTNSNMKSLQRIYSAMMDRCYNENNKVEVLL